MAESAKTRVRIRSDQALVTDGLYALRTTDGSFVDIRHCISGATVTLKVGEISRAHLDVLLVDADIEAHTLDDSTLEAFAHNLRAHRWTVEPPVTVETPPALVALAEQVDLAGGVTIEQLFDCVGRAARELAAAIRDDDQKHGPHAASAFLNALELLPASLREDIALAVTDRPSLAENPHLQRLAL